MPTKKKTEEITDSIMEAQNETEEQNTAPPAAEEQSEPAKRKRKLPKPRSGPLMRRSGLKRKKKPTKKQRQNP